MREREVRKLLLSVPAPDEADARRRAWRVVQAAYEGREPVPRRRRARRGLLAGAVALATAAVVAAVLTQPGRAVLDSIRDAIGREHVRGVRRAEPALFRLPTSGRLLVGSPRGAWVVRAGGAKRLLGSYRDATWSPNGRFVAAVRRHELVAVTPSGDVRWTLERRSPPRLPAWSPVGRVANDTRIAYLSGAHVRVVGGDGRGDRVLAPDAAPVQPAWRPGARHVAAYVTRGRALVVTDVDAIDAHGATWRRRLGAAPVELAWSDDGSRLAVAAAKSIQVFDARGRLVSRAERPGDRVVAVAFVPHTRRLVEVRTRGFRSTISEAGRGAALFTGPGRFSAISWSPDARWLLVAWPSADQWVFISPSARRVRAVSNISLEFHSAPSRPFPAVFPGGWCCDRH